MTFKDGVSFEGILKFDDTATRKHFMENALRNYCGEDMVDWLGPYDDNREERGLERMFTKEES